MLSWLESYMSIFENNILPYKRLLSVWSIDPNQWRSQEYSCKMCKWQISSIDSEIVWWTGSYKVSFKIIGPKQVKKSLFICRFHYINLPVAWKKKLCWSQATLSSQNFLSFRGDKRNLLKSKIFLIWNCLLCTLWCIARESGRDENTRKL